MPQNVQVCQYASGAYICSGGIGLNICRITMPNTWQCAVSHVFHVTGAAVQFICSVTDNSSLDVAIIDKRIRFLEHLKLNSHHDILFTLYMRAGLQELSRLRDIKLHACAE